MPLNQLTYWEDFSAGVSVEFGNSIVTTPLVVAFRHEFEPATIDPVSAAGAELSASDWHSCAILMRMMCDDYLMAAAGAGAPGVEHVRWFGTVRPGDVLRARRTPVETRASKSRPRLGIVRMYQEVFNQRGELVMTWLPIQLYDRRDPDAEPPPTVTASEPAMSAPRRSPFAGSLATRSPSFDAINIGDMADLGSNVFSKEEMLQYARQFNPQYFHADEATAINSIYGGLIASGWHTGAVWNRQVSLYRETIGKTFNDSKSAGISGPSIAVTDMKWPVPIRPGDRVSFTSRVKAKTVSDEFPGWGIVTTFNEGVNQRGETVFSLYHHYWVRRWGIQDAG